MTYNPFQAGRCYGLSEFYERAGIGPTKTYELIGSGQLIARKVGKKTILANASDWFESLPPPKLGTPVAKRAMQP